MGETLDFMGPLSLWYDGVFSCKIPQKWALFMNYQVKSNQDPQQWSVTGSSEALAQLKRHQNGRFFEWINKIE